jgi:UrcA family protein
MVTGLFNANQGSLAMITNSPTLRNVALFAAAFIAFAASTGPANAAQDRDVTILAPTVPSDVLVQYVRYGDLNLASAAGQARLDTRVRNAVDSVCPAGFVMDLDAASQTRACKVAAYEDARTQMDAAIAQANSGQLALNGGGIRIAARR